MMKMWNSMKLTIYYSICLTIVNGKMFSHKQRSLPFNRISAGVPSENYETSITNPEQSDYASHSDISDKTVLSNGEDTNVRSNLYVHRNVFNTNANRRNDNYKKIVNWPNGGLNEPIMNNGKQIGLKSGTSLISDRQSSRANRLRRSDNSRFSDKKLSPNDIIRLLSATEQLNDRMVDISPYDIDSNSAETIQRDTDADLDFPSNEPSFHRDRKGFRSSVVDRVAHGFGKRTSTSGHGLNLGRLHDILSQSQLGRAGELLSVQPDDSEELDSLLALYENLKARLQSSQSRYPERFIDALS
ncbi:uncharacterized protein LOC132755229 isoform X2 [Ruditapes philippinarum]|uniref:uncharacterized protein LOC132755229 isoform X2 n=1 Tax=Ruditapes philippinarum TaxID=129788 RepID=UPI00295A607C|nr:uncharacterized protein LOC132755229 isoform X2 [Ruditapes philippinarum]